MPVRCVRRLAVFAISLVLTSPVCRAEPTREVRTRGEQCHGLLLRVAEHADRALIDEFLSMYSEGLVDSLGEVRARKSVEQLAWELKGGRATGHDWIDSTTLSVEFRDCQVGPAMIVVIGLDPDPPHGIVKLLGHAELAPRADPLVGGLTAESIAARAESLLQRMAGEDTFSGAICIELGGSIAYRAAVGDAEKRWSIPNQATTRFNTASMSKVFTAAAALKLVEDGSLGLDDAVALHLPELRGRAIGDDVTIRMLLSHTSGMTHFWTDEFRRDRAQVRSMQDLLPYYVDRPLAFEPGTDFLYSNSGFALLGLLIERVTGETFEAAVQRLVFQPAGMRSTGWPDVDDPEARSVATGYTFHPAGYSRMYKAPGRRFSNIMVVRARGGAGGGAYTTIDDMIAFGRAFDNGRLLSDRTRARALARPQGPAAGGGRGLGFAIGGEDRLRWWGHTGGAEGASCSFRSYPTLDLRIVVLSNYEEAGALLGASLFAAVEATVLEGAAE